MMLKKSRLIVCLLTFSLVFCEKWSETVAPEDIYRFKNFQERVAFGGPAPGAIVELMSNGNLRVSDRSTMEERWRARIVRLSIVENSIETTEIDHYEPSSEKMEIALGRRQNLKQRSTLNCKRGMPAAANRALPLEAQIRCAFAFDFNKDGRDDFLVEYEISNREHSYARRGILIWTGKEIYKLHFDQFVGLAHESFPLDFQAFPDTTFSKANCGLVRSIAFHGKEELVDAIVYCYRNQ